MKNETTTDSKKQGNSIRRCNCTSTYQDSKYGPGMRVHTVGKKQETCTVCGLKK